jgi:hypothetical protein
MVRIVVGFRQDQAGDWVVKLDCGHERHVRHDPPWMVREWVTTEAGRESWMGRTMECGECDGAKERIVGA